MSRLPLGNSTNGMRMICGPRPLTGESERRNSFGNVRNGKPRRKRRLRESSGMRAATVLEFEIIQVVKDGCLARVLNDNQKRIFLELTGPDFAQGQGYEARAERSGTFNYTTVLGAPSTVERWTPLAKP